VKTAAQAAANWVGAAGRAGTAWTDGVNAFTGDWAGRTTAQQAAMATNWNQSVNNGTWANGVNRTGTGGWKSATVAKASNYQTGYSAGATKQASAIGKILQAEATIVNSLPPRGTFEQNVQRSVQVQTQLHALKGQLKAS
jgi:hypothetical protein